MEDTNDGWVGASHNAHDASLGSRRRTRCWAAARLTAFNAGDNSISVHRIAEMVRRNEEIAVEIVARRVRNHKAISVPMRDEVAREQIRIA
jgi:hypothetical protein